MTLHPAAADRALVPMPEPLPSSVIDAHTHLDACGIDDADAVALAMDRASAVGVTRVVTTGDDLESSRWAVRAAGWHVGVFAAVGIHPTRADTLDEATRQEIAALASEPRVVAIGETGLDYYWDAAPHEAQAEAFAWHITLAKETGKSLVVHDRDAHQPILDVLCAEGPPRTVVFHCFSGDVAFARRCLDAGFVLSFAGPVSFTNARDMHEVARYAPLDQVMVETDAPFLTPHPHRGRRNEPYALPYTVRALASLRNQDLEGVCRAVRLTTARVYGIDDR
jgi:TatD DNase family protein